MAERKKLFVINTSTLRVKQDETVNLGFLTAGSRNFVIDSFGLVNMPILENCTFPFLVSTFVIQYRRIVLLLKRIMFSFH